jgi:hypothetical protein
MASMPWVGGWMGPRASLDIVQKTEILALLGFKALLSSLYPVVIPTELFHLQQ